MILTLTPVRLPAPLEVIAKGDALILNGEVFDFTPLPEGAMLPASAIDSLWFAGPVTRQDGVLRLTLILPHGTDAPDETRFPAPITVTRDGPVDLPPYDIPEEGAPDED